MPLFHPQLSRHTADPETYDPDLEYIRLVSRPGSMHLLPTVCRAAPEYACPLACKHRPSHAADLLRACTGLLVPQRAPEACTHGDDLQ